MSRGHCAFYSEKRGLGQAKQLLKRKNVAWASMRRDLSVILNKSASFSARHSEIAFRTIEEVKMQTSFLGDS